MATSSCETVKDVEQRKKKLTEQGRCFICLRRNHRTADCRTKMQCTICKGRHHALICSKPAKKQTSTKQHTHVVVQQTNQDSTTVSTVTNTQLSEPREVLLMAKEATVTSPTNVNNHTKAMIFFDCGSQTSFITHDLAKKLNLKKLSDGNLEVFAFQQQPVKFHSPKYAIGISLLDGRRVEVILNSTNKIASSFKTATVNKSNDRQTFSSAWPTSGNFYKG
ncbi:putative peptidase (DUF1758) domain-containing protein [Ditylenchus destructor]|uniref:Peptidase (DUF1758) domain-containing protein n=1 Tax=Ditylenchus destructor TaxID=166010 RepID=A0AAD4ME95_9BILA|nr:putative peptidase (DUF1758) domain-containing protein [Ditylenchus destructor]